jgi:Cof subfamily protein (haloacid dehalogenase superfamily)
MVDFDPLYRWLIALDIDGTIVSKRGDVDESVKKEIRRVADLGHEVTLATGRSVSDTFPILNQLGISPEYVVCTNGATVLRRDPIEPSGYAYEWVETFSPATVLTTIQPYLPEGKYAVEDEHGDYYYTEPFPGYSNAPKSHKVPFNDLLFIDATRVVVISPEHDTGMEQFLGMVNKMGLHSVSYDVGFTGWLDIAPDGVNKATGLERVREKLGIPRSHVVAVGDGKNDVEMLEWAASMGRGVAMGQAPIEVATVANEMCPSVEENGVLTVLKTFR